MSALNKIPKDELYKGTKGTCSLCAKQDVECCYDGICRSCHKSITWEDCMDETYTAKHLLASGRPLDEVKELYPNARFDELGGS